MSFRLCLLVIKCTCADIFWILDSALQLVVTCLVLWTGFFPWNFTEWTHLLLLPTPLPLKNFRTEPYLTHIRNKNQRSSLTKIRISDYKLSIENGRHKNIPWHHRTWTICYLDQIGDEMHLLRDCSNVNIRTERETYLWKINTLCPQVSKLGSGNSGYTCYKTLM